MYKRTLPPLSIDAQHRVAEVSVHIKNLIHENQGRISFKQFMQEVLYSPKFGYYMSNKQKFGKQGDFVTSPGSSRFFGATFAVQFAKILTDLGDKAVIIEFGAGTGNFALDCLKKLMQLNCLPHSYYIVEISPDLKQKQQKLLKSLVDFYPNIHWLVELPESKFNAVIFANEVLDAMPIELIHCQGNYVYQMMVGVERDSFVWCRNQNLGSTLLHALQKLPLSKRDDMEIYQTEINMWIKPWLRSIRGMLRSGVVFICDYGYQRDLYYSKDRVMGTLQCYYRHCVHDNPLIYLGLQDITAHVDFTAIAEESENIGFKLEGFATQGNFLIQAGLLSCYQEKFDSMSEKSLCQLNQEVKQLTLGGDLAENFKVIGLSYGYDNIIEAFDGVDRSYLL